MVCAQDARLDELKVALDALRARNEQCQQDIEQREAVIRLLTESLAIARTESELFQKRWAEVQLRAQTLGVNFASDEATQTQRQLIESVRSLYVAEAERQRLVEQLKRLASAVQSNKDVAGEVERTKALIAASESKPAGAAPKRSQGTLGAAKILDVNPTLRLAVLDVGVLQGARVGMPFVVLRGDRVVAELKIVEVRQRICGALIEKVEKNITLAAGDAARVTKS